MDPNSLTHYGVKGMKWGVRRTPAQLGHSPAGRKKNGAVDAVGRAGNAAAKKVAGVKKARRDKIVAKAMASDASIKDLRKAIPYMTDAEIKKKMDRQSLENKLVDSNRVHEQKTSELGKSAKAIKKGADIGLTGASKTLNQEYVTQTLKPLTVAAGKAAGQKLLSVGADVAVGAAAKKLGIDEATAKQVAEQFKTVMAEDFAAAASSERREFTSKNNLGADWANEKNQAAARKKAVEAAYAKAQKIQDDREEAEAYKQVTKTWQDKQARNAEAKKQAFNNWVAEQQPKYKVKSPEERKATMDRVKQTQQNAAMVAKAQRHADNTAIANQMQSARFNEPKNDQAVAAEKKRHEENKAQARRLQEERMYQVRKKR